MSTTAKFVRKAPGWSGDRLQLVERAPACDHIVQFYESDQFLCETVAEFLSVGNATGESLVVIATPAHREGICRQLESKGIDVGKARESGRLTLLDAADTLRSFLVDGMPNWRRFQSAIGPVIETAGKTSANARVRAYGEMVDLLWRAGNFEGTIRLEEFWNDLGKIHTFSLFCAYAMDNFTSTEDEGPFKHVCATHNHVFPTEKFSPKDDHLREVSRLQQRARALETEIEHRKKLESELREALSRRREAEEALRAANGAKDEFLAMLGHELRNPLSPILTALQLMRLREGEIASKEHTIIERQVQHMIRLVDDLLDVSRITRGKVELKKRPVELSVIVAKAIEIASPLFEHRRHRLFCAVPASGMRIDVDEHRLTQVVSNLLTNAAKYTGCEGAIEVEAKKDGGQVVLVVRDSGMGIAPEFLPRVFDLFVQNERSMDRSEGGLGLGLAIVRSLVALHGGTVTARSEGVGRGSEFVVSLPCCAEMPAGEGTITERLAVKEGTPRRRILVVDDNVDYGDVLVDALASMGHEAKVSFDGPAALQCALEFVPEIVFVDIGLPVMDGYELARRLRDLPELQGTKLVAATGYGQESDRRRSREAGFDAHLVKPIDLSQVEEVIDGVR